MRLKGERMTCQALDDDAMRCRRQATHWDTYHGNGELYGYDIGQENKPTWVKVHLCDVHRIHDEPKPRRAGRGRRAGRAGR